jgi:hypothetical protein
MTNTLAARTLTAAQLDDVSLPGAPVPALAIEHAENLLHLQADSLLRQKNNLPADGELHAAVGELLGVLGDKPSNVLAAQIRRMLTDAAGADESSVPMHVANESAAQAFLDAWSTKDKLAERRATLLAWFSHERDSVDELHAEVEKLRAERAPTSGGKRKSSRAKRMLSTVSDKSTIENLAKEAAASGDAAMAEQLTRAAASGMMVVVATPNVIKSAGPAQARSGGGRAPTADKFAGMSVEQLQAEVKSMFGIETGMKAVAHLRYRLRLGAKAIAKGEKPVWNPASNFARVALPTLRGVVNALSLTAHHFGSGPERTVVDEHVATLTEAIKRAESSANQDSSSDDERPGCRHGRQHGPVRGPANAA